MTWCTRARDLDWPGAPAVVVKEADCVAEILSKVGYKPGWKCSVRAGSGGVVVMELEMMTTCVNTGESIPLRMTSAMPVLSRVRGQREEEAVVRFLRGRLHEFELHEADEWLTFDGERLFDPHRRKW